MSQSLFTLQEQQSRDIKELRDEIIALRISIVTLAEADKRYFDKFFSISEKQTDLVKEQEKLKVKLEEEQEKVNKKFEELETWKTRIILLIVAVAVAANVLQEGIFRLIGAAI